MNVSWFSSGVSSAVATKLCADELDLIIYTHIDDQHEDSLRFVRDCEQWFGKPVVINQSKFKNVEAVIRYKKCIRIPPRITPCTEHLKKLIRKEWEYNNGKDHTYFWGLDIHEATPKSGAELSRVERILKAMPDSKHRFPLVERGISKAEAHRILKASGIARPKMYDLGFQNNNCIGCVRGGMWYWNMVRKNFPDVFTARAKLEREIGKSCINGTFLDELAEGAGRESDEIDNECGIMCEMMRIT